MKFRIVVSLVAPAALFACGDQVSSLLPEAPTGAPCVPTLSVSGETPTDPDGPYFQQVVLASTANGLALTGATQVLDHASVPDGIQLRSGAVLIYYVNGLDGAVWVARYEDSELSAITPITVNGVRAPQGVQDPDVQALPNGDVRLTYLGGTGAPSGDNPRGICIADSDDGSHFRVRSLAFPQPPTGPLLRDPTVVRMAEEYWLMSVSQGARSFIARSTNGYVFTRDSVSYLGNVPELTLLADNSVRWYVCLQGISSFVSSDTGRTWVSEGIVVQSPYQGKTTVCDPSYIPGAGLFLFKTAD